MLDTDPTMHPALQVSLSDFLYKWLKLHVLGIDKKLEDFVLKSARNDTLELHPLKVLVIPAQFPCHPDTSK